MLRIGTATLLLALISVSWASNPDQLIFDVYLDDDRIGSHAYQISRDGDAILVSSKASFDVKFLFITAYKYRHSVTERWSDGCLEALDAETTANGKEQKVGGKETSGSFIVQANGGETELGECVMTFAYWNPDFLQQSQLLNPQTGEYLPVEVSELDVDDLGTSRKKLGASAYVLSAKDLHVTVWYSDTGEWVGLESAAKGGRVLRYEIA